MINNKIITYMSKKKNIDTNLIAESINNFMISLKLYEDNKSIENKSELKTQIKNLQNILKSK
jgi:hypothetical protein